MKVVDGPGGVHGVLAVSVALFDNVDDYSAGVDGTGRSDLEIVLFEEGVDGRAIVTGREPMEYRFQSEKLVADTGQLAHDASLTGP